MANLLEAGATWLADQLHAHASREVIYRRDGDQVTVHATIGRTEFEIDNGTGMLERHQSRDFLVRAADLVLGGSAALPIAGDQIVESEGNVSRVFEVMGFGNQPPWRYSDQFRRLLRIHTKQVA